MKFSDEELSFLKLHRIEKSDVFDGTGISTKDRKAHSKESGQNFLLGAPCKKGGHRLKTPNSDCIQCNPAVIEYKRRHRSRMTFYITHTSSGGLSKIGITQDITDRHRQLNAQSYGGFKDWKIFFQFEAERAGELEAETFKLLEHKQASGYYFKDGKDQQAKEMLRIEPNILLRTVVKIANDLKIQIVKT